MTEQAVPSTYSAEEWARMRTGGALAPREERPVKKPMGWYADPDGSGRLRWWTGTQWTETFKTVSETEEAP